MENNNKSAVDSTKTCKISSLILFNNSLITLLRVLIVNNLTDKLISLLTTLILNHPINVFCCVQAGGWGGDSECAASVQVLIRLTSATVQEASVSHSDQPTRPAAPVSIKVFLQVSFKVSTQVPSAITPSESSSQRQEVTCSFNYFKI